MLCELCAALFRDIFEVNLDNPRWETRTKRWGDERTFDYGDYKHVLHNYNWRTCGFCDYIESWHVTRRDTSNILNGDVDDPWSGDPRDGHPLRVNFVVRADFLAKDPPTPWWLAIQSTNYHEKRLDFELFHMSSTPSVGHSLSVSGGEIYQIDAQLSEKLQCCLSSETFEHDMDKAYSLVSHWSSKCIHQHSTCKGRGKSHQLPTRVIDVGPADGSRQPYLMESNGKSGVYIALSHRWGDPSNQFCTTRENIDKHKQEIPFADLPKTLQDSITICRNLGVSYLWIDSLAIIQGDDEDWRKEAGRMASIYERSYITISALRASGSDGILERDKDSDPDWTGKPFMLRSACGKLVGVRPHVYKQRLGEDILMSDMGHRGWILQERLLSPAILHFGKSQMYWECKQGTVQERWADLPAQSEGPLKGLLREELRDDCSSLPLGHFMIWYIIVAYYTSKDLTAESDRLPAIQGLAKRFQQIYGTEYLAGLWEEDLHRGLFWVRFCQRYPRHAEDRLSSWCVGAPSWSWASCRWIIRFAWGDAPGRVDIVHPVRRIYSDMDADIVFSEIRAAPRIHRSAISGSLQIWGVLTRVRCFPNDQPASSWRQQSFKHLWYTIRRDPYQRKQSSKYAGLPRHKTNTAADLASLELPCVLDFSVDAYEFEHGVECYCLILADWEFAPTKETYDFEGNPTFDSSRKELRCFLILEKAANQRKFRHPQDIGRFRRIGVGAAEIDVVERFTGTNRQKKYLTLT